MWNNAEHLAAYLAVPSMGAVLHTLNIRLSPEQIGFVANEAEDKVIIADSSLTEQLAAVLPLLETVHTVLVVGDGDVDALVGSGPAVVRFDEVLARQSPAVRLAGDRRDRRRRDVLHQRYHRQPERRCLQPPFELPPRHEHLLGEHPGHRRRGLGAADRADVPRQRLGACRTPR